jgi:hypothetical protein
MIQQEFSSRRKMALSTFCCVIEGTVSLLINDFKEFMKRGGQAFVGEQIGVVLKMPMTSLTGLSMNPERTEKTIPLLETFSHHRIPLCCSPKNPTT